jgi:hypothetical protein
MKSELHFVKRRLTCSGLTREELLALSLTDVDPDFRWNLASSLTDLTTAISAPSKVAMGKDRHTIRRDPRQLLRDEGRS